MFVFSVLHTKDKRHSQDEEVAQMKYRERRGKYRGGGEIFRTGPGTHPASCTLGTGFLFRR